MRFWHAFCDIVDGDKCSPPFSLSNGSHAPMPEPPVTHRCSQRSQMACMALSSEIGDYLRGRVAWPQRASQGVSGRLWVMRRCGRCLRGPRLACTALSPKIGCCLRGMAVGPQRGSQEVSGPCCTAGVAAGRLRRAVWPSGWDWGNGDADWGHGFWSLRTPEEGKSRTTTYTGL